MRDDVLDGPQAGDRRLVPIVIRETMQKREEFGMQRREKLDCEDRFDGMHTSAAHSGPWDRILSTRAGYPNLKKKCRYLPGKHAIGWFP